MKPMLRVLLVVLLSAQVLACSTSKPEVATSQAQLIAGVNVGNEVRVTTREGKQSVFAITKITNKALYGNGVRLTYAEIAVVETKGEDGKYRRLAKLN